MKNTQEFIENVRKYCQEAQTLTDSEIIDCQIISTRWCALEKFWNNSDVKKTIDYIEYFFEKTSLKQKETIDWSITFNAENHEWANFTHAANFANMAGYKQLWYNNVLYSKLNSSQWEKKNFTSKV